MRMECWPSLSSFSASGRLPGAERRSSKARSSQTHIWNETNTQVPWLLGSLHIRLRPSLQRDAASFRQRIDAPIEALEPAINIRKQYLARVRCVGSDITHSQRSCRQSCRTGKRLLPICRHNWRAGTTAKHRISASFLVFAHQPRPPLWIGPRHW